LFSLKKKTPAGNSGGFVRTGQANYRLPPVEQVLDTMLTLVTLKVLCDEEEPLPEEEPLAPPEADPPAPALPEMLPLVFPPLELLLPMPLLSDPIMRTWWPTWSLNFEVSPASCQVFPLVSVKVKLPDEPFRQPSMVELLPVEVCVVCVVVVVVEEVESGVDDWLGLVEDGVDCELVVSGADDGDVD
jgi:hypothetical protein